MTSTTIYSIYWNFQGLLMLASEDEDSSDGSAGIHNTEDTRAHSGIDEDQVDEHHNNGVDDDHRLNDDGHDNKLGCAGDNGIGEDDEGDGSNSKANFGDRNDGDNEDISKLGFFGFFPIVSHSEL